MALFVFLIIVILLEIVLFSLKIKISINKLKVSSKCRGYVNNDYEIKIFLYIIKVIPIFKITLTQSRIKKLMENEKIEQDIISTERKILANENQIDRRLLNIVVDIIKKVEIKNLDFHIEVGTFDVRITAFVVAISSILISIGLAKKGVNYKNVKYKLTPIYDSENIIDIRFSGIFEFKFVHIINMYFKNWKIKKSN